MRLWRTGLDRSLTNPDNEDQGTCEHGSGCSNMATTIVPDGRKMCNTHKG